MLRFRNVEVSADAPVEERPSRGMNRPQRVVMKAGRYARSPRHTLRSTGVLRERLGHVSGEPSAEEVGEPIGMFEARQVRRIRPVGSLGMADPSAEALGGVLGGVEVELAEEG